MQGHEQETPDVTEAKAEFWRSDTLHELQKAVRELEIEVGFTSVRTLCRTRDFTPNLVLLDRRSIDLEVLTILTFASPQWFLTQIEQLRSEESEEDGDKVILDTCHFSREGTTRKPATEVRRN